MAIFGTRDRPPRNNGRRNMAIAAIVAVLAVVAAAFALWPDGDSTPAPGEPVASVSAPEPVADEPAAFDPVQAAISDDDLLERAPDPGFLPREDQIADLYVASIDPAIADHDALALPDLGDSEDPRPRRPAPPRNPNAAVEFDAEGLVVPSPSGTANPDGVLIYSGKPDIVPPKRPATLDTTVPTPDEPPATDAPQRPRGRPGDLVPEYERATLGGHTRSELAALRPLRRPLSSQETAEALDAAMRMADAETIEGQQEAEAGTEAGQPAENAALAADLVTASRRAVAQSPMPRLKPANISQIAARARAVNEAAEQERAEAQARAEAEEEQARQVAAAAARQQQAAAAAAAARDQQVAAASAAARQQQAAAAAAAKQREAEARAAAEAKAKAAEEAAAAASTASASRSSGPAVPRSERANPTGPISKTVARRATVSNALALNKVSLIGVYGTSNDRRALVRLPSGRYEKVKVGSRLDGGRVVGIGQSEVLYKKGNRNISLKMPKG